MIDHEKKLSNRRVFFTALGTTGIASAALLTGSQQAKAQSTTTDIDVVQFALNLAGCGKTIFWSQHRLTKVCKLLISRSTISGFGLFSPLQNPFSPAC